MIMEAIPTFTAAQALRLIQAKTMPSEYHVIGDLEIAGIDLEGVIFPKTISGSFTLCDGNLDGVALPTHVGKQLFLAQVCLSNMTLPEVGEQLCTEGVTLINVEFPRSVPDVLWLAYSDVRNAVLPVTVGKCCDIDNCEIDGIVLPQIVGSSMTVKGGSLHRRNIALPECKEVDLCYVDLRFAKFPETLDCKLELRSCELKGAELPVSNIENLTLEDCDMGKATPPPVFLSSLNITYSPLAEAELPEVMTGHRRRSGSHPSAIATPHTLGAMAIDDCGSQVIH
jgi:uncharacterized protein YjbI with pentapeptide repeats